MVLRRGAIALTRYHAQNASVRLSVVIHSVRQTNRLSQVVSFSGSHVARSTRDVPDEIAILSSTARVDQPHSP